MDCSLHNAEMPKPRPVSVNGVVIPREAIAREVQHHPAGKPMAAWKSAARALAIRELLLQEARKAGIEPAPLSDAAGRRETEEEALVRGLIEREVKIPDPDEAACRRYYEQNMRLFRSATIFEAAHILFAARRDDKTAFDNARREASAVLEDVRAHPERFADLARDRSACTSAAQGGNLGQISAGQTTPEFEAALVSLEPGETCAEPVATRYGLHIIRLDRKIEGRTLPYELVADRIADYLRESVRHRAIAQYIARLVSRADIAGVPLDGAEAHRVN